MSEQGQIRSTIMQHGAQFQQQKMYSIAFLVPPCGSSAFFGQTVDSSSKISVSRTARAKIYTYRPPMALLEKRKLGSSELDVTDVCLGTMTWGIQNSQEDATEQLDYAIKECGINFIDTAESYPVPVYHPQHVPGRSEDCIGNWIANNPAWRKNIVVATKVAGRFPNSRVAAFRHPERQQEDGIYPDSILDTKNIYDACDASLRRLNTDYIDLYQLHWPDRYVPLFGSKRYDRSKERESVPIKETLTALKDLLDQGKIRAYGLSNETTYGVAEFVRAADELGMPRPASIQNGFCLVNRSFECELAEACSPSHYNIGLMAYSTLGGGVLSGKYTGKAGDDGAILNPALQDTRFSLFPDLMPRYMAKPVQEAVVMYKQIAEDARISLPTLAQAFCKSRSFVASSIIGATSIEQLKENISAFHVKLDDEILTKIDEVHELNKDLAVR